MKRLFFAAVCAIGMTTAAIPSKAQVSVSINIGVQPLWGPVGYDYVEYYYLPDLEMYYYVPAHKFVYINGGRWIFVSSLPYRYRHYDLYTIHKVVINEPRPYRHFHFHKRKYAMYRGGPHKQVMIRNSNDPKYYVVKGHPNHGKKAPVKSKRSAPAVKNHQPKGNADQRTKSTAPKQHQQKNVKVNRPQQRSDHQRQAPGKTGQGGKHGGGGGGNKGGGHKGGKR